MRVRLRLLPSGLKRWEADLGLHNGRRVRVLCRSKRSAMRVVAQHRRKAGREIQAICAPASSILLRDAITRHINDLTSKNRSSHTSRDVKNRLRSFLSFSGVNACIGNVTEADASSFLDTHRGRNAVNHWRTLRGLFSFAVKMKWIKDNPITDAIRPDTPTPRPATLTVEQVNRLLDSVDARLLPYVSIGIFAGLRPGELAALDWSEVDLTSGNILVMPDTSKVRRARFVPICDRLSNILRPLHRPSGRILPLGHTALSRQLVRAYRGLNIDWQQDIMRHTYATMRIAVDGFSQTAADMGTSEAMLIRHYRGLARRSDATLFFSTAAAPPPT